MNKLLTCALLGLCGFLFCGTYLPLMQDGTNLQLRDVNGKSHGFLGSREVVKGAVPERIAQTRFGIDGRAALRFAGRNGFGTQLVTIPAAAAVPPVSITFEAWFKSDASPREFTRLMCIGDEQNGGARIYTKNNGTISRIILALLLNGKVYELGTPPEMEIFKPDTWVHIAASYNAGNGMAQIFINGAVASSGKFPAAALKPAGDIIIGNRLQGDRGFVGIIDEIRISDSALSKEELGFSGPLQAAAQNSEDVFEWEGSRCGITYKVPSPWKDVQYQVKGDVIQVFAANKEFVFDGSILPEQIIVNGKKLFSGGMRLLADNLPLKPVPATLKVKSSTARKVVLSGCMQEGNRLFDCETVIEFDGVSSLSVTPAQSIAGSKITTFKAELTLPRSDVPLAKVGSHAGKLEAPLKKGWSFPMWVGGEQSGITLFAESDQWWVNPRANEAFTVQPTAGEVVISVNFISAATTFKSGSRYCFHYQPTPIRDFPEKRPESGFLHGAFPDMEKTPGAVSLIYDAEKILDRHKGTLDMLVTPDFDPQAKMQRLLGREPYIREIFSVVTLGQERFRLCFSLPHGGIIADEGIQPSSEAIWDGTRKILFNGKFNGVKNREIRLTLCWGDGKIRCFADGKEIASCERDALFEGDVNPELDGKLQIRLGESICNLLTPRFGSGIRVSALHLRKGIYLPQADGNPFKLQEDTLLLETFRNVQNGISDGKMQSNPVAGPSGRLSAGGSFVSGAVQLYQTPDKMKVTCLDRVAEIGTTAMIFHQGWSSIQSHYQAENPAQLRALIEACHQRGIKLLLYFGFELSEAAPEFEKWHRKALRLHPERPTPELPQVRFDQKCGKVCYGSQWQDFITFAIDKSMRDFGFDGVFIDAAMVPYPCPNELHGCGWRDSAGKLHATMPVMRYLEMIRRISQVVRSRGGLITGNQASGPLWAYPDSVWVGEGYKYQELGAHPEKAIPLPAWRSIFAGRNYGIPGELLLYEYPAFWRRDTGWALAGLHGMFLRPENWWKGSYLEKIGHMRKVFRQYPPENTDFIAYYDEKLPLESTSPDVVVSVYRKHDKMLLWCANLTSKSAKAEIIFDREAGVGDGTLLTDPMTAAQYTVRDGKTFFDMAPYNWRMLEITLK